MQCPECSGLGLIHIPAKKGKHQRYDLTCPTCEGAGELPDPQKFPNNCPACGEPIGADQKWCELHKEAENINLEEEEYYCGYCDRDLFYCSSVSDPNSRHFDQPACPYCGNKL